MNVITYGPATKLPSLPRLKPTVVAIPLDGNRIALRRGTNPIEDLVVHDPTGSSAGPLLDLLDGTRDLAAITAAAQAAGDVVDGERVSRFIADLQAGGVLDDAAADTDAGLGEARRQRYSRNLNCWSATVLDGRTPAEVQRRLLQGHALVIGVGGLGSAVAQSLAMAGCGTLTLVDFDEVELQNLNRQCLYDTDDIGRPKAEAARERVQRINPDVTAYAHKLTITSAEQAEALIRETNADVVVGGADRPAVAIDRWLTDACLNAGVPYVGGALSGAMGRVWTKVPGGACFTCDQLWTEARNPDMHKVAAYREARDLLPATSALSFGVQVVAGLIGFDVLHHLLGLPVATAGRIIAVDFGTLTMTMNERPLHPACERHP